LQARSNPAIVHKFELAAIWGKP